MESLTFWIPFIVLCVGIFINTRIVKRQIKKALEREKKQRDNDVMNLANKEHAFQEKMQEAKYQTSLKFVSDKMYDSQKETDEKLSKFEEVIKLFNHDK